MQEVHKRESQLKEYLHQLEDTRARVAEALIIKGAVAEVVCRKASSEYHQASGQLAELQEELEGVVEALQAIGLVLAGIEETSRSKH